MNRTVGALLLVVLCGLLGKTAHALVAEHALIHTSTALEIRKDRLLIRTRFLNQALDLFERGNAFLHIAIVPVARLDGSIVARHHKSGSVWGFVVIRDVKVRASHDRDADHVEFLATHVYIFGHLSATGVWRVLELRICVVLE